MTHFNVHIKIERVDHVAPATTQRNGGATERKVEEVVNLHVKATTVTAAVAKAVAHMRIEAQEEVDGLAAGAVPGARSAEVPGAHDRWAATRASRERAEDANAQFGDH